MRYIPILLCTLFIAGAANGQELVNRQDKRPVLFDDIRNLNFIHDKAEPIVEDIPVTNLSNEQVEQLWTLQVAKQKKLNNLNNLLTEKQAQQQTLEAADKANMKAINKVIDEQIGLISQQMKLEAEYKQKIRSILTEDQRIQYDARTRRLF